MHWANGGETGLDNLILLCRYHHRLVHDGSFSCERTACGEVVFRDEREQPLPTYGLLPTVGDDEVEAWLEREFFDRGIVPIPVARNGTPASVWTGIWPWATCFSRKEVSAETSSDKFPRDRTFRRQKLWWSEGLETAEAVIRERQIRRLK